MDLKPSKEVFCRMAPNPCDFPNCACDMKEYPPMPLIPRPQSLNIKDLEVQVSRLKKLAADRLIGLCKCGEERTALQTQLAEVERQRNYLREYLYDAREVLGLKREDGPISSEVLRLKNKKSL